jgi:hypothetical protein
MTEDQGLTVRGNENEDTEEVISIEVGCFDEGSSKREIAYKLDFVERLRKITS